MIDVALHWQGTRYVMDAYVGTVFVGGGFAAVMDLVAGLVDPTAASSSEDGAVAGDSDRRTASGGAGRAGAG